MAPRHETRQPAGPRVNSTRLVREFRKVSRANGRVQRSRPRVGCPVQDASLGTPPASTLKSVHCFSAPESRCRDVTSPVHAVADESTALHRCRAQRCPDVQNTRNRTPHPLRGRSLLRAAEAFVASVGDREDSTASRTKASNRFRSHERVVRQPRATVSRLSGAGKPPASAPLNLARWPQVNALERANSRTSSTQSRRRGHTSGGCTMKTWLTVAEGAEVLGSEPRHDLHGMRASRAPARACRRATGNPYQAGVDRCLAGTTHTGRAGGTRDSQDAGSRGTVDHEDSVDGHESGAVFRCQERGHWNAARSRFHDAEERTATDRPPAQAWRWLLNTSPSPSISQHWSKILPGLQPFHPGGSQPCCRN